MIRNVVAGRAVMRVAGVLRVPGPHLNCLHGLPFGWSRVAPLAERRPAHQRLVGAPPSDLAGAPAFAGPARTNPAPRWASPPSAGPPRPPRLPPSPPAQTHQNMAPAP